MAAAGWRDVRREWSVMSHYQLIILDLVLGVTYWLMRERDDRPTHP